VLLVGNPALPLKGFDVAIAVLAMVNRVLPLRVTWICQTQPTTSMVPGLASCGLRINLHISPSQVEPPASSRSALAGLRAVMPRCHTHSLSKKTSS
jgi:hypothetical protein